MVSHFTVCIISTKARARIYAFLILACFVHWTVSVELALWPAVGRLADHAGLTRAVTAVTVVPRRVGVGPTGVGVARVFFNDGSNCCKNNVPKSLSKLHGS